MPAPARAAAASTSRTTWLPRAVAPGPRVSEITQSLLQLADAARQRHAHAGLQNDHVLVAAHGSDLEDPLEIHQGRPADAEEPFRGQPDLERSQRLAQGRMFPSGVN